MNLGRGMDGREEGSNIIQSTDFLWSSSLEHCSPILCLCSLGKSHKGVRTRSSFISDGANNQRNTCLRDLEKYTQRQYLRNTAGCLVLEWVTESWQQLIHFIRIGEIHVWEIRRNTCGDNIWEIQLGARCLGESQKGVGRGVYPFQMAPMAQQL